RQVLGRTIATAAEDGSIRLWEPSNGKVIAAWEGQQGRLNCLAFSPDGKTLASGGDDKLVKVWDRAAGKVRATLEGHAGPIRSLAFTRDGKTIASGSDDETVKLWNAGTGELLNTLNRRRLSHQKLYPFAVTSLVFIPDGQKLVAAGKGGEIRYWRTSDY